jgi:hypothetical protein
VAAWLVAFQPRGCRAKPGLHHETITIAHLLLINERVDRTTIRECDDFAAQSRPTSA